VIPASPRGDMAGGVSPHSARGLPPRPPTGGFTPKPPSLPPPPHVVPVTAPLSSPSTTPNRGGAISPASSTGVVTPGRGGASSFKPGDAPILPPAAGLVLPSRRGDAGSSPVASKGAASSPGRVEDDGGREEDEDDEEEVAKEGLEDEKGSEWSESEDIVSARRTARSGGRGLPVESLKKVDLKQKSGDAREAWGE
jgi:hypothetical protein